MSRFIKIKEDSSILRFLYRTLPGRVLLKLLAGKTVSTLAGNYMDHRDSRRFIASFAEKNQIDLNEYEDAEYGCFNDFFIRKIRKEERPIDMRDSVLVSPCDGMLSAYKICHGLVLPIKQSCYSINRLLQDEKLAREYAGGTCLVFRLGVNNYHRYMFADSGRVLHNRRIDGVLHTVRPVALCQRPVFTENTREYCQYQSKNFGRLLQMEIGAMLVGKIANKEGVTVFKRGDEKGCFLYGGSTIVLLIPRNQAVVPNKYFEATDKGYEIAVKMGEPIAKKSSLRN